MAAPLEADDEDLVKDDFYSLLNVSREANKEEINQAYKQLSRIYHPDKHLDPVRKKHAEALFAKLKRAHEVLGDEHKRTIYDLYGEKGLESYGKEVISRTKTPAEIIAEYERYQKEQEEERLQKRTNPKSTTVIGLDASDLFDYDADDDDYRIRPQIPRIEMTTMHMSQSIECPLTNQNTVTLSGNLTSQNGRGVALFSGTWKRYFAARGTLENGRGVALFSGTWKRYFAARGTLEVEPTFGQRKSLAFRYSQNLFRRCTANCQLKFLMLSRGIAPSVSGGLTYQFDKNWQGRIRWEVLAPVGLHTFLSYSSEKHNVITHVKLNVKESFLYASYTRNLIELEGSASVSVKAGTMGLMLEYEMSKKITSFSTIGASVNVATFSGVNLQIKLIRGKHTLMVPVALSEEIIPSAVLYGTFTPVLVYFIVKKLIVDPFLSEQREKDLEKKKQEQQEKVLERKKEAEALIDLMKETVDRSMEVEERKNGLVILKALYGKLTAEHQGDLHSGECIDVTIPLQALVKDSKLISPEKNPKSSLPGFYDPCIGEDKRLYIKYKFRRKLHHVTLNDTDQIRLPQQKHLIREEDLPLTISDDLDET